MANPLMFPISLTLVEMLSFFTMLGAISAADAESMRIPEPLLLILFVYGIGIAASEPLALLAGSFYFVAFYALQKIRVCGDADKYVMAAVGFIMPLGAVLVMFFLGAVFVGNPNRRVSLCPYIMLGCALVLLLSLCPAFINV